MKLKLHSSAKHALTYYQTEEYYVSYGMFKLYFHAKSLFVIRAISGAAASNLLS